MQLERAPNEARAEAQAHVGPPPDAPLRSVAAMLDESEAAPPGRGTGNPYRPIAVGFWLLSLPLWISIGLAGSAAGAWTNGIAAAVMLLLGLWLWGKRP